MKSLLIIDDDQDIGDALTSILKEESYYVRFASSGKMGLILAQESSPDLILLDWQMPQMGGKQVLAELASMPKLKDIPVILMSANIANIPPESLLSRKYLRKPFDVDLLISMVAATQASCSRVPDLNF